MLGIALLSTIGASRIAERRTRATAAAAPHEMRGAGNVIANCAVGTLGAAAELSGIGAGTLANAMWFITGIAAGASDTVASEIGQSFGGTPRAFPTWMKVPPGTPGAVSAIGTVAGLASSTLIAAPAWMLWLIPLAAVMTIVLACAAGSVVESALSTRFESRGKLDNNTLNLMNTALAASVALVWAVSRD